MFSKRLDKQFEEAGRDPEQFEKLLQRSKRDRKVCSIILLGIVVLLLMLAAWLVFELIEMFLLLRSGRFEMPRLLAFISDFPHVRFIFINFLFVLFMAIFGLGASLRIADSRVKTLLLFRGLRDAKAPDADHNRDE